MEEPPEWLASIATQLQTQETTTSSIRELIDHYTRLYTQYLTLSKTHKEFRDTLKLKEEEEGEEEVNVVVNAFKPKSRSSTTSGFNLQMVHSLKQDKLKLEKEVNGLHQLIQQLHMTIKEQEKLNRRIFTDLQGTQTSLRDLQTKYNDSLLLLQVKDEAIQIVQDEFTALQLELSTKEKENGLLKKENQRLTIHPPRIGVPSTYSTPSKSNEESSHPSGKKTNFHEANEMVVDQLHHLSISFKGAMKQFLETNHTHSNTTHAPLSTTESHGLSFPVSYEKEYASLMNKHKDDQVLPQSILKTWRVHEEEPLCLAVSLDGKWLATGGSDRYVKLWQSHLAHPITSFATAFSSILAVQFGPNYLVSASADNIVRVYDVSPPKLLHTFTGHVGKVTGIAVGSQTRWCVSGAGDRTLKLWDLEHGYCRQTFFAFSHCLDVTACDSGLTQVASAHEDGKVRVWDTLSGQLVHDIGVAQKVGCLSVVAKDIHQLITLSRDNLVRVIDLRSMQLLPLGSNHMRVGSTKLGLSPKGTYVSVGAMDGSIFVWDLRTNEHLVLTGGHGSQVNHVQWDPVSGSNMYSIDKTGHLTVWGATT